MPARPYPLTQKQRCVLCFIQGYQEATGGACPTLLEIARALGLTAKSNIQRIAKGLEERGYIERLKNHARSIRVISPVRLPRSSTGEPLRFIPVHTSNHICKTK
ncbi:MAG: helix-turn-helix domain-containing protein [Shewanella sp.]